LQQETILTAWAAVWLRSDLRVIRISSDITQTHTHNIFAKNVMQQQTTTTTCIYQT